MISFRATLVAALVVAACPSSAAAALKPGDLDPGFGTGGIATFEPSLAAPKTSYLNDVAVDAQGRTLVTGQAADAAGKPAVYVGRLNSDGSVDTTFGNQPGGGFVYQVGTSAPSPGRPYSIGTFVAPAPGGKILVGVNRIVGSEQQGAVALRLNDQGRLDLDYGSSGIASVNVPSGSQSRTNADSAVVKPDGSLVMTGEFVTPSGSAPVQGALFAWDANGQPSTVINSGGNANYKAFDLSNMTDANFHLTYSNSVVALPSGRYLVGGQTERQGTNAASYVARLTDKGGLDTTYGGGEGVPGATLGQAGGTSTEAIANGPDTAAYGVAGVNTTAGKQTAITRYGASGQIDSGWANTGVRILKVPCTGGVTCDTYGVDVRVDSAKRVLVLLALRPDGGGRQLAVARYKPDGTLDTSFGTEGISYGPAPSGNTNMVSMEFAPDNRLVMAGLFDSGSNYKAVAARMALEPIADPAPPAANDPGGSGQASSSSSPSLPTSPSSPADVLPPALSKLSVKFAKRRGSLSLTSSEAGTVAIKVTRARPGRKSKGKCSTRAKTGKKCTAYVSYRSVSHGLTAGTQKVALGSKAFAVGRYRASVTAKDATGNASKPVTLNFSVKKR